MAGAYKQALIQQVAAAMKAKDAQSHSDQENLTPDAKQHDSCQAAVLQLAPPTPMGGAPMHAAAMSVAAKGHHQLTGSWAAPVPAEGEPFLACPTQELTKEKANLIEHGCESPCVDQCVLERAGLYHAMLHCTQFLSFV